MRAVFFGTPPHAVPALAALCSVAEVSLVVTQPDRPRGRSGHPVAPAVKEAAAAWGLPVRQPDRASETIDHVAAIGPDVAVVVAFGQLIPAGLLRVPPAGFVNLHFSLLPRWRGASPVVRAILAGDPITGVTLMRMDETLDTGPILASRPTPIGPGDTAGTLTARLSAMAAGMVTDQLAAAVTGEIDARAQDHGAATAAGMVKVAEAHVDAYRHSAEAVDRAVRAFDPWPGAWSRIAGARFKLWKVRPIGSRSKEPGQVVADGDRVVLGTARGALELLEVQPEGRPRMAAADWMRGRRGEPARLDPPSAPPPR